jgi:hypothetical protein
MSVKTLVKAMNGGKKQPTNEQLKTVGKGKKK